MDHELQVQDLPSTTNLDRPMTVQELTMQSLTVDRILNQVMVRDIHYGQIPGTQKPTLYQAGAEKICVTFRLAPKYQIEDLSEPSSNIYRYRATCSLYTIRDGTFVASAVGEASTQEEKYSWQKAVCDEQWDEAEEHLKRKKFNSDGSYIKQVARNAADLANTVLKISTKRAYISATRAAVAASDLLEVDLDDEAVADVARSERGEQPQEKPKPKAKQSPVPTFSFGEHKGKPITDPGVPIGYLEFMADSMAKNLDDPKRKNFKVQNQLFIAALDTEIAARKAVQTPSETNKTAPSSVETTKPDETVSQSSQEAPAPTDYIAQIEACESVKDCSDVLNSLLTDDNLSREDRQALDALAKQKLETFKKKK